jgi:DNA-directed RNA polymerase alpha subunit
MTVLMTAICLPTRVARSLQAAGIHTADDLRAAEPAELARIPGIGTASLGLILSATGSMFGPVGASRADRGCRYVPSR